MNKLFFVVIHLSCILVIWSGVSTTAVLLCLAFYLVRMFAITAGYHRLFSHRSYKTGRVFQFILGALGACSAQKGPMWWAASHRHHHRHSDTELDIHSPKAQGIWWAHIGWVLSPLHDDADMNSVKDLAKYPEIIWLEKYHYIMPFSFLFFCYLLGVALSEFFPSLGTSPFQIVVWGALISTVFLYHGTFAINSISHVFGRKRFKTSDESRNSLLLALITLGEGWHNNHHRYPGSERQGFYWWEIDISHMVLMLLSKFGIVWDLRTPPQKIYDEAKGV
jgi:stearoyl-CoA desaturase (Delta-9 desaturase)